MESAPRGGKRPVSEGLSQTVGTRVPQDTRNPVGSREDHLPRLNMIQ